VRRSNGRIEVDHEPIGMRQVPRARSRHVQLDRALIRQVRQVLGLAHHRIDRGVRLGAARFAVFLGRRMAARHGQALDRRGIVGRHVLLEKTGFGKAFRVAPDRQRATREVGKGAGRDALVVRDDFGLGLADLRKYDALRIGHLEHRISLGPQRQRSWTGPPRRLR
jgi:hypothetical protein